MVRDNVGKALEETHATSLLNSWRESGELRVRPGLTSFGNIPSNEVVLNLFTAEFADGTKSTLRFDKVKLYNFSGSVWNERMAGATVFGGTSISPFGVTMALNEMVYANGVAADGVRHWTGTGDEAQVASAGILTSHNSFRYIAAYGDRVIGAYTTHAQGAIYVVGSAIGSVTDWTTANGAFETALNLHPSAITGLTTDDNAIYCWRERGIIRGVLTPDPDFPIDWSLLRTEGIGLIAPRVVGAYGGFQVAMSHEGIYLLAGGVPEFIDSDIKKDLARRLNFEALRQCFVVLMPEKSYALFFMCESSDLFPRNVWAFDFISRGWERWELGFQIGSAARAFLSTGRVVDDYDDPATDIVDTGIWASTIVDTLGTGVSSPAYILGTTNGATLALDFGRDTDSGESFAFEWQTPDVTFIGQTDPSTGETVTPFTVVNIDRVVLEYNHTGSTASVECSVSVDGGVNWTVMGTSSITSSTSAYNKLDFWGRVAGNQLRVRIRIAAVLGLPRFRSLEVYGQAAGERR